MEKTKPRDYIEMAIRKSVTSARPDYPESLVNRVVAATMDNLGVRRDWIKSIELAMADNSDLQSEIKRLRMALEDARSQLRATQENWHEDCLFRADEIMTDALND